MGLLSDPNRRRALISLLTRLNAPIWRGHGATEGVTTPVQLALVVVGEPGGQRAVAPPVLGGGAVARREGRGQEGALQVLLEQLAGDAGLPGGDQEASDRGSVHRHWPITQRCTRGWKPYSRNTCGGGGVRGRSQGTPNGLQKPTVVMKRRRSLTCCLRAATVMKGKTLTVTQQDDDTSSTTTESLQHTRHHESPKEIRLNEYTRPGEGEELFVFPPDGALGVVLLRQLHRQRRFLPSQSGGVQRGGRSVAGLDRPGELQAELL
ncbi:hypothetical protein EYF80_035014 [Liparis tanakae]|uniref:Uncharacterized protein n=1 Tax=Liparis tanakae TaxID=230148 RepID=A0A4Z2GMF3_9TELE|nr:hypothetical protein EYF80_035014 [Liparis tanakae]